MGKPLKVLLFEYEREIVTRTLRASNGSRDVAASALGITRRGLEKILERHHLVSRRYTKILPIPPEALPTTHPAERGTKDEK